MFSDSVDSLPFDFLPEMGDRTHLDDACLNRVVALSQTMPESIRWQCYLALLALEGFTAWLADQTIAIPLNRDRARFIQPTCFDAPAAITDVGLNQLQVCLIAVGADAEEIECPTSVIDDPAQIAHLYIAIAVDDEQGQVEVQCFVRYDQLMQYHQRSSLRPTEDDTYLFPRAIFDADLHHLLLFAIGLQPTAIARPTVPRTHRPAIQQMLLQPAINTANWARQQISNLSAEVQQLTNDIILTWAAPELQTANALRSSQSAARLTEHHLFLILTELQQQGYEIPHDVRAAFQDMVIGERVLRLSLVSWLLPAAALDARESEWSLLAIAQMGPGSIPAEGIRMAIRDQQTVIVEKALVPGVAYEVAQVIGALDEQFMITFSLPSGDSLTLPPLTFQSA